MKFYWFHFSDGYRICCADLDRVERMNIEREHGKLLFKTLAE